MKKSLNLLVFLFVIAVIIVIAITISISNKNQADDNFSNKISSVYIDSYSDDNDLTSKSSVVSSNKVVELGDEVWSDYVMMICSTTNRMVCKKNENEIAYPASLTKIATAIAAIESGIDLNSTYTLTSDIFDYAYAQGASTSGLRAGQTVTVRDLLYGTLLPSGADTAIALARAAFGTEEDCVSQMNVLARKVKCKNTSFTNVTGLHDENNYTTAADMALILIYALKNNEFKTVFTAKDYVTSNGVSFKHTLTAAMGNNGLECSYIKGGKTGFTPEAKLCLASYAEVDGIEYVLVTMGAGEGKNIPSYNALDAVNLYMQYIVK